MKIEIWSDVMCPFCYIGKRKFELALQQFPHKDQVEVEWHAFQLDPEMETAPGKTVSQYLAERKGWSIEQAQAANTHVTNIAAEVGLHYQMDKAIPANSFDAHRFSHLAAQHGLQDKAEERLFAAYFTEGKNISDAGTLAELGNDIGLPTGSVAEMLQSEAFVANVKKDIGEAEQFGISGVPFFVLDRKYAVSGAQAPATFLQALQTAWNESAQLKTVKPVNEGDTCSVDGDC
ncbi:MAG: DsbA family oxidoreductase [Chitinophagaceae bacterium]